MPVPHVLSTPAGTEAVPDGLPALPQADAKAAADESKAEADNTARLAAALPLSQTFATPPDSGSASGSGSSPSDDYKGMVYGAFSKADDLIEAARAKHLKGRAVVAFSIDDQGAVTHLAIAVSSGNPEIDETAMAIIRRSAPFPPPPPGAPHYFSPAIELGINE